MHFTKMQGLGNDYVYLDCTKNVPEDLPELARRVSDRHFGIGSDGLICILSSDRADFRMRMFNADGSEGEMCGNGIRCVGRFVYDKGLTDETSLTIETLAGIKDLYLTVIDGKATEVTVNMGAPEIGPPMELTVEGRQYSVTPVSIGNPHIVLFMDEIHSLDLVKLGPLFEHDIHFPNRVNTEFVKINNFTSVDMRVWERGSGETMACGTGACAAAAAAMNAGLIARESTVRLLGGDLKIRWMDPADGGCLYMTGPAHITFEGEWNG